MQRRKRREREKGKENSVQKESNREREREKEREKGQKEFLTLEQVTRQRYVQSTGTQNFEVKNSIFGMKGGWRVTSREFLKEKRERERRIKVEKWRKRKNSIKNRKE